MIKKSILFSIMLFFNIAYLFADIGNRGRLDTPHSAFSDGLAAITAIIVGAFFVFFFIGVGIQSKFKDKEANIWGGLSIVLVILGVLFLVSMCSH